MAAEETVLEKYGKEVKSLGEGAFGKISLHKVGDKSYAIKKMGIIGDTSELNYTAIREIAIMKRMDHPNILKLEDIIIDKEYFYLVTKFMNGGTLEKLSHVSEKEYKSLVYQMLCGMAYMHSIDILHRDIKPQNIFLNKNLILKLADFGMSKALTCVGVTGKTTMVVTLWYRPPELLYGGEEYGKAIDMWSVGCVIYEILTGEVLFKGDDAMNMILLITERLGTPTEATWTGITSYPNYRRTDFKYKLNDIKDKLKTDNKDEWLEIIKSLLKLNPEKRATALEVLANPLFDKVRDKDLESKYLNCLENLYAREMPLKFEGSPIDSTINNNILNWMTYVSEERRVGHSTFFISLYIYYKAINKIKPELSDLILYGSSCLYIALEYEVSYGEASLMSYYINVEYVKFFESYKTKHSGFKPHRNYGKDDIINMSLRILKAIDFDLVVSTSYDFLVEYGKFYQDRVNDVALILLYYTSLLDISYQENPHDIALICIMISTMGVKVKFKHSDKLRKDLLDIENACKKLKREWKWSFLSDMEAMRNRMNFQRASQIIEIACKNPLLV